MGITGWRCMSPHGLLTFLLVALASTMSEPALDHFLQRSPSSTSTSLGVAVSARAEAAGPGQCTFLENPACGNSPCAEIDSPTYPGYKEEFVCCSRQIEQGGDGGPSLFVDRICVGPNVMTPCGLTGPRGCAICAFAFYEQLCQVHAAADEMLIGVYRDATTGDVQLVTTPERP